MAHQSTYIKRGSHLKSGDDDRGPSDGSVTNSTINDGEGLGSTSRFPSVGLINSGRDCSDANRSTERPPLALRANIADGWPGRWACTHMGNQHASVSWRRRIRRIKILTRPPSGGRCTPVSTDSLCVWAMSLRPDDNRRNICCSTRA